MTRFVLHLLAMIACALACAQFAGAQSYPAKPVRVIVPFPPGETPDIIARLISPLMSESMGQQFIVENRAGASGQLGLEALKNAPADGYSIAVGQGGNLVVAPHTYKKLSYDPLKDFAAVALNVTNYVAVVAYPAAPFKDAADMIAWAKTNPGKLSVATNGEGGFNHLAFEMLASMGGFKFLHVPYKGAAQITTDVISGQVHVGMGAYTGFVQQIQSGRLRLIAVTNPLRVPNKPELPLFADAVPKYDMRGWFGYVAPAATPREIVRRLNAEINRAIQQPDVAAKLVDAGLIIVAESPEYYADFIKSEYAKYGEIVRSIGFQPQ